MDAPSDAFLWVKALHIIAVVCWFAALFYLPRLYVYHAMSEDTVSHQRFEVIFQRLNIELLEFFAIVEARTQRGGLAVVLVQDVQVQGFGPPFHGLHAGRCSASVHDRTFSRRTCVFVFHVSLLCLRCKQKW